MYLKGTFLSQLTFTMYCSFLRLKTKKVAYGEVYSNHILRLLSHFTFSTKYCKWRKHHFSINFIMTFTRWTNWLQEFGDFLSKAFEMELKKCLGVRVVMVDFWKFWMAKVAFEMPCELKGLKQRIWNSVETRPAMQSIIPLKPIKMRLNKQGPTYKKQVPFFLSPFHFFFPSFFVVVNQQNLQTEALSNAQV